MVFTLHRYIFRELFKVFVLATVAMTVMLSLGSLLRPIQEHGVGPEQAIHLIGYFIPITLTFVLPMAALFASALVYGRFACDNELDACKASGVSLATLVYPGLCLAIMVAITTLILSFHVVPAFVQRAERTIKDNVKQILFRSIQRKGYYSMPGGQYRIYADRTINSEDILEGVVIIKLDNNEISKIITAEKAKIVIDKKGKQNRVRITATEFYQLDETGQAYSSKLPVEETFPPFISDDIKFKKMEDIQKIKADMTYFNPIREIALECRSQLAIEMLVEDISQTISNPDENKNYYVLENEDRKIAFTAGGCELSSERNLRLLPPIRLVEFEKIRNKLLLQWASNQKATIKLEDPDPFSGFVVVLENSAWETASGRRSIAPAPKRVFRNMELPKTVADKLTGTGIMAQIDAIGTENSQLKAPPSKWLTNLRDKLQTKIWRTTKAINSEIHSRLVFGLGCIILILIAIALGIVFRGGHLLSAFGASAIPAGILIIFILSGKELAKTQNRDMPNEIGIIVMWSGLVLLTLLAAWIYRKITRT